MGKRCGIARQRYLELETKSTTFTSRALIYVCNEIEPKKQQVAIVQVLRQGSHENRDGGCPPTPRPNACIASSALFPPSNPIHSILLLSMPYYSANILYDEILYQLYNRRPQELDNCQAIAMASGPHTFAICVVGYQSLVMFCLSFYTPTLPFCLDPPTSTTIF